MYTEAKRKNHKGKRKRGFSLEETENREKKPEPKRVVREKGPNVKLVLEAQFH